MFQIKVNNKFDFEIEEKNGEFTVKQELVALDRSEQDPHRSHILLRNRSYNVDVVSFDRHEKSAIIKVNGRMYTVQIKDQFDQLLKRMGMDSLAANKILQVKAPMPGLVLNVLVTDGNEVKKGDNLLVLEAMKMENIIKSPTDGKIKSVSIAKGDKVEKNQLLISFF